MIHVFFNPEPNSNFYPFSFQVRELNSSERNSEMANIQEMFQKAKEHGEEKVNIAIQTYELVDKHIRKLDSDLAKFEAEMKEKGRLSQTETEDEDDEDEEEEDSGGGNKKSTSNKKGNNGKKKSGANSKEAKAKNKKTKSKEEADAKKGGNKKKKGVAASKGKQEFNLFRWTFFDASKIRRKIKWADLFLILLIFLVFFRNSRPSRHPLRTSSVCSSRGLGHAGRPQRAHVLPLRPGLLRRDDRLWQLRLPDRVVPLWLHGTHQQTQGQVVLPQVPTSVQEKEVKASSGIPLRQHRCQKSHLFGHLNALPREKTHWAVVNLCFLPFNYVVESLKNFWQKNIFRIFFIYL